LTREGRTRTTEALPNNEIHLSPQALRRIGAVAALGVLAGAALIAVQSGWYTLDATSGEAAVVQRFGKYIETVTEPGLHFKLPLGIDKVTKERVQEVRRVTVGFRSEDIPGDGDYVQPRSPRSVGEPEHSVSITKDHNLVNAEYVVQYEISDIRKYLFSAAGPDRTVSQAIKAVVRDVIANRAIDEILTTGRDAMQQEAQQELQILLDKYDIGIRIKSVQFQDVHAPGPVIPAFDDVQKAKEEMETSINEGKRYTNTILPRAQGMAQQMITEAEGYKIRRINEAKGDALRFQSLYDQYKTNRELTRRQLYLQVMSEILPGMQKTIIEGDPGRFLFPLDPAGKGNR